MGQKEGRKVSRRDSTMFCTFYNHVFSLLMGKITFEQENTVFFLVFFLILLMESDASLLNVMLLLLLYMLLKFYIFFSGAPAIPSPTKRR